MIQTFFNKARLSCFNSEDSAWTGLHCSYHHTWESAVHQHGILCARSTFQTAACILFYFNNLIQLLFELEKKSGLLTLALCKISHKWDRQPSFVDTRAWDDLSVLLVQIFAERARVTKLYSYHLGPEIASTLQRVHSRNKVEREATFAGGENRQLGKNHKN